MQTLDESLKKALGGKLEPLMLGLIKTPAQFDAHEIKRAVKVLYLKMQCAMFFCYAKLSPRYFFFAMLHHRDTF